MHPKNISIKDYTYSLPDDRIANFPLPERDASKLLIYKEGKMTSDIYKNIAQYLPEKSLLVFNNTRVIQARILFQKPTGGTVEIFCLEPYEIINEYSVVMNKTHSLQWKCMIGGASKWKQGELEKQITIEGNLFKMSAKLVEKLPDAYVAELQWEPASLAFAEIIEKMGDTPLPPYIKRKAEESDKERYQTVYAKYAGSVAAPTAGLHFTPAIFSNLETKGIASTYLTLHVGAGTFKPIKAQAMEGHEMHSEWIDVGDATVQKLVDHLGHGIIAVGTTSVRTLESLYWMGVKTILFPEITIEDLAIKQWEVYEAPLINSEVSVPGSLETLLKWMQKYKYTRLFTSTQILVAPGYEYKIPSAIVTNFHQPQSTLLLLVAAAIGNDWKEVYNYAMENDYRFLSYGDGSLLFLPKHKQ